MQKERFAFNLGVQRKLTLQEKIRVQDYLVDTFIGRAQVRDSQNFVQYLRRTDEKRFKFKLIKYYRLHVLKPVMVDYQLCMVIVLNVLVAGEILCPQGKVSEAQKC